MTILYSVNSRHTKEVLEDFIRFDGKIRHPMTKIHLSILGIGFLALSWLLRGETGPMLVSLLLGILLFGTFLFSRKIAFYKLSVNDEDYKNQNEILYEFGQSGIHINSPAWTDDIRVKYGEINALYEDKKNYYVSRNNEELYLLPFRDFTKGDVESFRGFMEQQTKKRWMNTQLPLRERLRLMNEARKEADRRHDEAVERRRKKGK